MAERRMFAKTIIDSDAFLDMSLTAQALYFHLSMRADDDGFINNPKKVQRMIGASDDDFRILIAKSFLIPFQSGIVVIKHWRIHNYIQADRYKETVYTEEKSLLTIKENKAYTYNLPEENSQCIQNGYSLETQVRLGKDSLGKVSQELVKDSQGEKRKEPRHKYGEYAHVALTDTEYNRLCNDYGDIETGEAIRYLDEYKERKGYKSKNDNLTLRKWVFDAVKEDKAKKPKSELDEWRDA